MFIYLISGGAAPILSFHFATYIGRDSMHFWCEIVSPLVVQLAGITLGQVLALWNVTDFIDLG